MARPAQARALRLAWPARARTRTPVTPRLARRGAAFLALLALGGAGAASRVAVSDAWVRGTVEGQTGSGAYLRLTSEEDAQLVGASSPVAARVEIHEMKEVDHRMTMRAIERLALPAHRTVALEHGLHVMLIGLQQRLQPGQTVTLRLHLVDAQGKPFDVDVQAPVRPLNTPLGHD
jgi:copper(I)-binding protein